MLSPLLLYLATAGYQRCKPLPPGIGRCMPARAAERVQFFADRTFQNAAGQRHCEQQIFDEIFRLIRQARQLVVLDMFLFNAFQGAVPEKHRLLCEELVATLLEQRQAHPSMRMILITDPFNGLYGGVETPHQTRLQNAGVEVVVTRLQPLRDSNPAWSALWRLTMQWFGNSDAGGWLPNPVGPGKVTLRSYLSLLNFKANHRKTLVVDEGDTLTGLVTSANPHDASSAHSNVALRFSGMAALDLLETEMAVARFSRAATQHLNWAPAPRTPQEKDASIRILTEGAIRDALIDTVESACPGDRLLINVFFFAHRRLIAAVLAARRRQVAMEVLLDPNKDAFGRTKGGIPNRQAAWELTRAGIPVRWANTQGEQCHSKMLLLLRREGPAELILGSANFTRRNLDNLNLETDAQLTADADHPAIRGALTYFRRFWDNVEGEHSSLPYGAYADHRYLRYWRYRLMEASGWSIF